ncbi:MAG: ABC transporter ATP-binding protein, partial [Chloroflexi bacterium]|nr:ABC transporter ATP-binding protein [Chloroflexota bacterium]
MNGSGQTVHPEGEPGARLALETRGVSIAYGDRTVVHDLDLAVASGEMVALLG